MDEVTDKFRKKLKELLRQENDPGKDQVCPVCSGVARLDAIVFTSVSGLRLVSAGLACSKCGMEYGEKTELKPIPSWVPEAKPGRLNGASEGEGAR